MNSPRIIAEIGLNHNGSSETALKLIRSARDAGVWGVKFQYRNLENAYSETAREIGDEIVRREIEKNWLPPDEIRDLAACANELGVVPGISFFDAADVEDFPDLNDHFGFTKLPSVELTNPDLIELLLGISRHLYLSTGAHSEAEIEKALGRISNVENWTALHCVSNYPTAMENARLGYIRHLERKLARKVGYSSHDEMWEVCILALQMGASVIERHITFDKLAQGLDHTTSSTPDEFEKLARFCETIEVMTFGDEPRSINQGEMLNRQNLGRSYFAVRDIAVGERVRSDMLVRRSPQTGIGTQEIAEYLDRPAIVHVPKGAPITVAVFERPKPVEEHVLQFARNNKIALPVRLHDIDYFDSQIPTGHYEFHLSFAEVLSRPDATRFSSSHKYSIHLPDYVNSTQLLDIAAQDADHREASLEIVERTAQFAEDLQQRTGYGVPIVGSFSVVHETRREFFSAHSSLINLYKSRGIDILPQWLPPIAWYFGGSVKLHAMNERVDAEFLMEFGMPFCMDVCHLFMGEAYSDLSATAIIDRLAGQIGHLHIADASGFDGEGEQIGDGKPENIDVIRKVMAFDCFKVIEVWQGHLNGGAKFREALVRLEGLSRAA